MTTNDLCKEWIFYAEQDIDTVRFMQTHHPIHHGIVCYHCQQAAEKVLKSVLAQHGKDIPKTHQLPDVLALVVLDEPKFGELQGACADLTIYAAVTRYPAGERVVDADMRVAVRALGDVLTVAREIGLLADEL